MISDPPRPALILGPAGVLPFAGLAAWAVLAPAAWVGPAAAAYGATILAFLGAVHWGLALRPLPGEAAAAWPRLGLGVVPALVAWVALLLPPGLGLWLLAAGLMATAGVETLGARRGWVPPGYLRLRWGLSGAAAICCIIVTLTI